MILPSPSPLEGEHYDLIFLANAVRSIAKYSKPVFDHEGPAEEDLFAKLISILRGEGADADPARVHEEQVGELLDRMLADSESPIAGWDRDEILAMLDGLSPVEKLLDLRLRTGWQGDAFGDREGGISLEKLAMHPHGVDLGPMVERFPSRLKTASGKLELAPEPLLEDWKRVEAAFEQGAASEGLLLIGRRHVRSNNSWMHNLEALVSGRSRCTLLIHPEDAERLGLENGGESEIRSKTGSLRAEIETSEAMMPGVVCLPHGWGHDVPGLRMGVAAAHSGVNSNELTDDEVIDVVSGNAVLNGIPVEVSPLS